MAAAHALRAGSAQAQISAKGAELTALDLGGVPVLWSGDPAWWGRHAPLLFPFIGRLPEGGLAIGDGRMIQLSQHGFARDRDFTWIETSAMRCVLRLEADEATRAAYPFDFTLTVAYDLTPTSLTTTVTITNPGAVPLPFTFGFHPAFQRTPATRVILPRAAEATLLSGGLLDPHRSCYLPAEFEAADALFAEDALIMRDVAFDRMRYEATGLPPLEVRWCGFDTLALWTKPGAPFLCIEPWCGTPAHVGTTGIADHPGAHHLRPGGQKEVALEIAWAG